MTEQAQTIAVRRSVTVQAPPERAFAAFTEEISAWWPLATHHIGAQPPAEAVVEPRTGGRWFERAADGSECDWGRVLAWEPPSRLVLTFEVSADWQGDPGTPTEVEVRFTPEGSGATRVDLVHRGLELYGERAEQMRTIYDSPGGWAGMLDTYAGVAAGEGA
jgi:uncharacterized protein YndB with AHSA1/START domain